LATIVIAWFTVELYFVSNRQWRTMQRQMTDFEAVQRAHLVILEPFSVNKGSPHGQGWWLTDIPFQVKNVGQSVANEIGISFVGTCADDPRLASGPAPPIDILAQPNPSGGSIAVGDTRPYEAHSLLTQYCIDGLSKGTAYAWIQIAISYRDVFGIPQVIADSSCYVPQHHNLGVVRARTYLLKRAQG
jgi:hypothetical protein